MAALEDAISSQLQLPPAKTRRVIPVSGFVLYAGITGAITSFIVDKKKGENNSQAFVGALVVLVITGATAYAVSYLLAENIEE